MQLSRVINNLEEVPIDLREFYEPREDGKYAIKISGMVSKSKLKEFRNQNVSLLKENATLREDINLRETKISELKDRLSRMSPNFERSITPKENIQEGEYHLKLLNSYRYYSELRYDFNEQDIFKLSRIGNRLYCFEDKNIIIKGRFLKIGCLEAESYEYLSEPGLLIEMLKCHEVNLDLFTFIQSPVDKKPHYNQYFENDNLAVIPIKSYEHWWNNQIKDKTRNLIRKAQKKNIIVKKVSPDDNLIGGIYNIFNETPFRQGRKFHHYGKNFELIKREVTTFPNKSDYIGAYYNGELVGFLKVIYSDKCANIIQILSMNRYRDKAPTNAIISKAIKLCEENDIKYLVYRKFIYGKKGADRLTEFKKNNGFIKLNVPRYYIPLTKKGELLLKLNFHHGLKYYLPKYIYIQLSKHRSRFENLISTQRD